MSAPAQLDAVLPLTAADLPRAQILFRTLDAFFEPLGTCWVVAPDADVATVRRQVPQARYAVVAESEVVRELPYFRTTARVRAKLRLVGPPIHGWFVQQLLKLAIADRVSTRFYLTLDADVICVRPTHYDDLVVGGRALVQASPPNHPEWNDDAERVLGLRRSGRQYGVTPAVLSRDAVRLLAGHLSGRVEPRLRRLAAAVPAALPGDVLASWRSLLLRSLPWTEYALYHTFLERTGLAVTYHHEPRDEALYGNCVWIEGQFDDWAPSGDDAFPFSVVQSATRIAPERVWAKVAPLVEPETARRSLARTAHG